MAIFNSYVSLNIGDTHSHSYFTREMMRIGSQGVADFQTNAASESKAIY